MRKGDRGEPAARLPLDQVSSQQLARAAQAYAVQRLEVPEPPRHSSRYAAAQRLVFAVVLPPCLFVLGMVMLFGLARGTAGKLAGDGGFSLADLVMLALLVLAAVTVAMQAIALAKRRPGGRVWVARAASMLPSRPPRPMMPTPAAAAYLDQVDPEDLEALVGPGFGTDSRLASTARFAWRTGDTVLWIALGAASIAIAALAAFGLAFSIRSAVVHGNYTPLLVMLGVFCAMAFVGLAMMTRTVVIAIFDRSRRRRRPAVIRVARAASKPITSRQPSARRDDATGVAVAVAAALLLVVFAFWPEVSEGFGGGSDDPSLAAAVGVSPTPTAFPIGADSAIGQLPRPSETSSPAPAATSEETATPAGGTGVSAALTAPTSAPPIVPPATVEVTPEPTAAASPTASPAPTSSATPAPTSTAPPLTATSTPSIPTPTPTSVPTATATAFPTPAPTVPPTSTVAPTSTPTPEPSPTKPPATATAPPSDGSGSAQ